MNYVDLGHKLKVERTKLNYKQDYLALKVGVGQRYISKIEHGLARPEFEKVFTFKLPIDCIQPTQLELNENNPGNFIQTIPIEEKYYGHIFQA